MTAAFGALVSFNLQRCTVGTRWSKHCLRMRLAKQRRASLPMSLNSHDAAHGRPCNGYHFGATYAWMSDYWRERRLPYRALVCRRASPRFVPLAMPEARVLVQYWSCYSVKHLSASHPLRQQLVRRVSEMLVTEELGSASTCLDWGGVDQPLQQSSSRTCYRRFLPRRLAC